MSKVKIVTPRDYFSYSSWRLWRTNKNEWIRVYIYGVKRPDNRYTALGRAIHKMIQDKPKDPVAELLRGLVRRYKLHEHELRANFMGVPLMVRPDGFSNGKSLVVGEYKSGMDFKNAIRSATQQLRFTNIVLKAKFKRTADKLIGHWIETKEINNQMTFTGQVKSFEVHQTKDQFNLMAADIVKGWSEIIKVCKEAYAI